MDDRPFRKVPAALLLTDTEGPWTEGRIWRQGVEVRIVGVVKPMRDGMVVLLSAGGHPTPAAPDEAVEIR